MTGEVGLLAAVAVVVTGACDESLLALVGADFREDEEDNSGELFNNFFFSSSTLRFLSSISCLRRSAWSSIYMCVCVCMDVN